MATPLAACSFKFNFCRPSPQGRRGPGPGRGGLGSHGSRDAVPFYRDMFRGGTSAIRSLTTNERGVARTHVPRARNKTDRITPGRGRGAPDTQSSIAPYNAHAHGSHYTTRRPPLHVDTTRNPRASRDSGHLRRRARGTESGFSLLLNSTSSCRRTSLEPMLVARYCLDSHTLPCRLGTVGCLAHLLAREVTACAPFSELAFGSDDARTQPWLARQGHAAHAPTRAADGSRMSPWRPGL